MGIKAPSRAKLKRWALDIAIVLAVFFGIQAWQQRDIPTGKHPQTGGWLADGQAFCLNEWRAKHPDSAVALHFWAEWCPICASEEDSITSVSRAWPVMTVAMQSGSADQVRKHLKGKGLSWPALVDANGQITAAYGLKGVPAFIVISPDGTIDSVATGYTTELGMRLRLWWASL